MNSQDETVRLSRLTTHWSVVLKAHDETSQDPAAARQALLRQYASAVHQYLLGAVRDPDAADELFHEFVVRLLRGDFRRSDPSRGRFRDYLKKVLVNLVNDYHRARQAWPRPLSVEAAQPDPSPAAAHEPQPQTLEACLREEALNRTWEALRQSHIGYHRVLQMRVDNPDLSSSDIAERLDKEADKALNAALVRKTLQRARAKFGELLLDEVARLAESSAPDALRAELDQLDLLKYCRSALERRRMPP